MKRFLFIMLTALLFESCASIQVQEYPVSLPVASGTAERAPAAATAPAEPLPAAGTADGTGAARGSSIRIVQISDFHSNDFGEDEALLLENIRRAEPDIIVFTGDTFDFKQKGGKDLENVRLLLSGIQGSAPFFYVSGNHEYFFHHDDEYSRMFTEYGGTVLRESAVFVELPQGSIIVAGVSDPYADLDYEEREEGTENREAYLARIAQAAQEAKALRAQHPGTPAVLLAHRPEYIDDYLLFGFDVILSGHAHGGQWRLPGINGLYAPNQGLFPRYAGGRYDFVQDGHSTAFIISRGLSWQRPYFPRIMNNPELVVIQLSGRN